MRPRVVAIAVVSLSVAVALAVATHRRRQLKLEVGGLYSVHDEENEFGSPREYHVAKVLAVDEAVHLRIYREAFRNRPVTLEGVTLTLGDPADRDPGMDHVPLSRAAFAALTPVLIARSVVTPDELEGYRRWSATDRGVWK